MALILVYILTTMECTPIIPFPFQACTTMTVCGSTKSGKTTFVRRIIDEKTHMFTEPAHKILYCYSLWTDSFTDMEKSINDIEFHKGLPEENILTAFCDNRHNILVLDDLMADITKSKTADTLFMVCAHHMKLSVIFLSQNIFPQGKIMRNIALNTHVLVLFRNYRDVGQISVLGRQLGSCRKLQSAYDDATNEQYGYLVLDMAPGVSDRGRWRTKIFPGEDTITYE